MKKYLQGFALHFLLLKENIISLRSDSDERTSFNDKIQSLCACSINICKELQEAKCESALINYLLCLETSIGANINVHGKADFVAKLQIALKKCSESEYWIELLLESGYYNDKTLLDKSTEAKRILIFFSVLVKKSLAIDARDFLLCNWSLISRFFRKPQEDRQTQRHAGRTKRLQKSKHLL